ncbi:MAG: hypothetical protein AB7O44_13800 [Hyphomicrobiaceae bacterium]
MLCAQTSHIEAWPVAVAVTHGEVNVLAREVDMAAVTPELPATRGLDLEVEHPGRWTGWDMTFFMQAIFTRKRTSCIEAHA